MIRLVQINKYNKVIVFSGGGTRFAMYCGMFAAMEDMRIAPDLIIGACGGAIATTVITSFETNQERKRYLQSEELYEFIRTTRLTKEKMLYRIGCYCLKKICTKENAPFIENVFDRYLVDMPQDITGQLPSLSSTFGLNIPSIIIGSEILFDPSDTGKTRNEKKLYRKVLFTDEVTARKINCDEIQIQSEDYTSGAIDSSIDLMIHVPMLTAMRISVSDMFYVKPVSYQDRYFAGGAIDLTPIELAQAIATHIIFEKKSHYTNMEESLVRAVLGFSGNKRLLDIDNSRIDHWIDTTDATQVLNGHYCKKKINWLKFQVSMTLPYSYQQFIEDMEMQWQYGYEKVKSQFGI